ncbi:hypothetical protein CSKR_107089 [Clonorchis sinensis]|uniref:Uncharacterized protein n=1 Tax=Clonorchis sinensis TaxID=79923 RepID=A0A419QFS6_CLOSI|nr:hypothetical protein CSKR_107089 [Clonorchis sinensis]
MECTKMQRLPSQNVQNAKLGCEKRDYWRGARLLSGSNANLLTGRSVVRARLLPPDFSCLGLGNLIVSEPSYHLLVAVRHRKTTTAERFQ